MRISKVKNILQYFLDDNPGTDMAFACRRIAHLLDTLGVPPIGLNRLDQLYKYVTIKRSLTQK